MTTWPTDFTQNYTVLHFPLRMTVPWKRVYDELEKRASLSDIGPNILTNLRDHVYNGYYIWFPHPPSPIWVRGSVVCTKSPGVYVCFKPWPLCNLAVSSSYRLKIYIKLAAFSTTICCLTNLSTAVQQAGSTLYQLDFQSYIILPRLENYIQFKI
jgi:hypothetical protein